MTVLDYDRLVDGESDAGEAIVKSIIDLAAAFHVQLIAEGVETERQLERLGDLGCTYAQGYLFSKPLCGDEMVSWLVRRAARESSVRGAR